MGGQKDWKDAGSGVNDYVVKEEIVRSLYYEATYGTIFGKLNDMREVKTTEILHKGGKKSIDSGNDSPIFEKQLNENNTALFTMREENKGMATYGDADVKTGSFAEYKNAEVQARTVDTPAYPIVGFESADNIKRVVSDLVAVEKSNIAKWIQKEFDLDGFRALYMGASRGLLDTENGGKGVTLNGGAVGQHRSCLNTLVAGQSGLTARHWGATAHNSALAALLAGLSPSSQFHFTYETHQNIDALLGNLNIQSVKLGGQEYRAVVLIDPRNMYRLREDQRLREMLTHATPRSDKNTVIYNRGQFELDDILYIPVQQMKFFRPRVAGGQIIYGCGMDQDPRSTSFTNTSNITTTIVLGRGALRRGRRKGDIRFTVEEGRHGKGQEYCAHYDDGWMRNEWYTRDGRQEMLNDSSVVLYNCDSGVGGLNI